MCGIRETVDLSGNSNQTAIVPIDIAGTYVLNNGRKLDAQFTLLRKSQSNLDVSREGVRAELHGGRFPFDDKKKGMDQRAIVEFVCDPEREGNEDDEMDDGEHEEPPKDGEGGDKEEKRVARRDEKGPEKCEDTKASLRFCGYEDEEPETNKKVKTLRLEWRTKYACKNTLIDQSSRWGFFTWFIIM